IFFFSSRRRHTRSKRDWSSDVCSSDLSMVLVIVQNLQVHGRSDNALNMGQQLTAHLLREAGKRCTLAVICVVVNNQHCLGGIRRSEERRVGKEGRDRR